MHVIYVTHALVHLIVYFVAGEDTSVIPSMILPLICNRGRSTTPNELPSSTIYQFY